MEGRNEGENGRRREEKRVGGGRRVGEGKERRGEERMGEERRDKRVQYIHTANKL